MSRIVDEAYFKYSVYSAMESGIQVKCPKCQGLGVIVADDDNVHFKCTSCGHQKSNDRTIYRYCTLSEYLSQSRFKMRLERNEWDKTGKAEITRDRANLTETILRVCDSNNEKNGQNFISVFEVMKNKRIIG